MKKLPLAIAALSLFAASNSFSQQFNQDFRVSLDIPSSIDISGFQQETIALNLTELQSDKGTSIGSIAVKTTSSSCYATITTDNSFKLVGPDAGFKLPYELDYIANNNYYTENIITTPFSAKISGKQKIGCGEADIKMRLLGVAPQDMANNMTAGGYNDVVRIQVTTSY